MPVKLPLTLSPLARRTLIALCLGSIVTISVSTCLANLRDRQRAASRLMWSGGVQDDVVLPSAEGNRYFHVRELQETGFSIVLVRELPDGAVVNSNQTSISYTSDAGDEMLRFSKSTLPARLAPRSIDECNALNIYSYGWPLTALGYREYSSFVGCFYTNFEYTNWLRVTPRTTPAVNGWTPITPVAIDLLPPDEFWGVPTAINPIGFAVNTLTASVPCFALHSCFLVLRTRLSRRHNICPYCSYDRDGIAATALCPECGKPA